MSLVHSPEGGLIPTEQTDSTANLIERLEADEVGSRELDEEISNLLCSRRFRSCIAGLSDEVGGLWMYEFEGHNASSALRVTSSLDAALAMSEQVFPDGWLDLYIHGGRASAAQCFEGNRAYTVTHHSNPIAVCIAILKAAQSVSPSTCGMEPEGRNKP